MPRPLRLLTVVGARPQFVKAAVVSRALRAAGADRVVEELIHTGQHYDDRMSRIFFDELGLPRPAVNLGIGSGSHGAMTGRMLEALAAEMEARRPDRVLVYGDTNSTLAGALAAAKLCLPVAHVEAGLRSFNRRMPEEVNRVLTDHLADLLLCPTPAAVRHLEREGIGEGVRHVGDVMYDAALLFAGRARAETDLPARLGLASKGYALATVHRAENTDDPARLAGILGALGRVAEKLPVVLPLHPRTRARADAAGLNHLFQPLCVTEPLSFLEMIRLEMEARLILTDSGGVQKEAFFHRVPCITLREETEWVETVESGWNALAGADPEEIVSLAGSAGPGWELDAYGDGHAAEAVTRILLEEGRGDA